MFLKYEVRNSKLKYKLTAISTKTNKREKVLSNLKQLEAFSFKGSWNKNEIMLKQYTNFQVEFDN